MRAELLHEGPVLAGEPEIERRIGVLLMIEPDERLRRLARAFAATFVAARSEFVVDLQALAQVATTWPVPRERQERYVALVVSAPAFSVERGHLVENVVEVLDAVPMILASLHACVAEDTRRWASLSGFGFVRAEAGQLADVALSTFGATCALMAPIYWAPVDDEDVRACFGTAESPATLALQLASSRDDELRVGEWCAPRLALRSGKPAT